MNTFILYNCKELLTFWTMTIAFSVKYITANSHKYCIIWNLVIIQKNDLQIWIQEKKMIIVQQI